MRHDAHSCFFIVFDRRMPVLDGPSWKNTGQYKLDGKRAGNPEISRRHRLSPGSGLFMFCEHQFTAHRGKKKAVCHNEKEHVIFRLLSETV